MTHEQFLSLNPKPNCYVKVFWGQRVLLEGKGIIVGKALTDETNADVQVVGKDVLGRNFSGWFRCEDIELIEDANDKDAVINRQKEYIALLKSYADSAITMLRSVIGE